MKRYLKKRKIKLLTLLLVGAILSTAQAQEAAKIEAAQTESNSEQVVQVPDGENIKKLKATPATKKKRIAQEFLGVNEKGEQVALRYPGAEKQADDVPDWSIASLVKLSDYGLLSPDDIHDILSEPDRQLMAKFTARAYHLINERDTANSYDARFELDKLMREYDTELRNLGYGALDYVAYTRKPFNYAPEIGGELRYNYVDHTGDNPYNFYDHRIRFRPYIKQMVNENWYVYAMGEGIKSWVRHDIKNFSLIRLFVGGKYKDVNIRAGRYGEYYADGNIYDGRMDGVSVEGGEKITYKASYGRLRNDERGGALIAKYKEAKCEAETGIYSFDNIKGYGNDTIYALGGMYYIGNFGTGAMYLKSSKSDASGASDGYIITVQYGRHRTAVPGTFELFAKYYNQADTTYISHTMSGLADYMDGFKGHSVGMYYTFAKNYEYAIEYYDLKDKKTGRNGRTLWNHVSYFFD